MHYRSSTFTAIALFVLAAALPGQSVNCPAPATGAFTGCYYGNLTLDGNPVLTRTDSQVDFDWGSTVPAPSLPGSFSVRWQGYFVFNAGECVFSVTTSDGMRLYVDGVAILDRWRDQPPYSYTARQGMTQGAHLITVEYYDSSGWGKAHLSWQQSAAVGQVPVIQSFTGNPATVVAGQAAMLSWSVSGANTISLDNGIGDVTRITSQPVSPASATTYTLTASNSSGTATASATVTVGAAVSPQRIVLPASAALEPGDTAAFPVALTAAAPPGGVFMALGSSDSSIVTVTPKYVFIVEGNTSPASAPRLAGIMSGAASITASAAGLNPASMQVQVLGSGMPPPPVISSFSASPSTVVPGQSATLSWIVAGAASVSLDNGIGDVSKATSKVVAPAGTTVYTLTASNAGGTTVAHTTVTVTPQKDVQPPTAPILVSAIAKSPNEIDLVWTASSDNVGVAGYQISRNGVVAATVTGAALTYADTGLAANATYTYSLKAYDAAGNYSSASNSLQTATSAGPGSTVITACQPIAQSGHYVLGANLMAAPNSSCIVMHDTHDVYLDCQQHTIAIDRRTDPGNDSAIVVSNVVGYSIANCTVSALNTGSAVSLASVSVMKSPRGSIVNNVFSGGYLVFNQSDQLDIGHNVSNAPISVSGANETIEYNTISLSGSSLTGAVLGLSDSAGSSIHDNVLDGGWDGVPRQSYNVQVGADDGILVSNVTNTTIQRNTIRNIWDAGIENVRPMVNVQLLNNQIASAGTCGMGGWYGNSLNGVTVAGNTVTDTPRLFDYWRADGLYTGDGEQTILFVGNTFSGNTLVKPRLSFLATGSGRADFQSLPGGLPASTLVSGGNIFGHNDFGPFAEGVKVLPASSIVDGGGNVCLPDSPAGFPLLCTPPAAPPGGYYAIAASAAAPSVVAPGSAVVILFGANPPATGDYIGLAAVGADDQHWLSTQVTAGSAMNTLIFKAPMAPGQYEFRYMKGSGGGHVAVSNSMTVGTVP